MKADKTYVFKGAIYLPGAEMPEGWTPPVAPKQDTGITMYGPEGVLTSLPGIPLPPNVTAPGEPVVAAGEAPVHMSVNPPAEVKAPEAPKVKAK